MSKQMESNLDATKENTTLWEDYQKGIAYQNGIRLTEKLPKFVKFFEGEQWAPPTKNTKNLPRPIVNIVKMFCRNKKSSILSVPVKIVYRADDPNVDVEKFNRFAEYAQKEMRQEELDKEGIDDGVKKGTYVYHYYWDNEAKGMKGKKEGGMRGEVIDPLNVFFSDPTQRDEQKQKWIIIASRESVEAIRAKCDEGVDKEGIVPDELQSSYGTVEQEGDKLCTVLTRYFRKDGEVYCEKATKSVLVNAPFPITPDLKRAGEALGLDADPPNNDLPDNHESESLVPEGVKADLYPIVVGNYEKREGSIYGLGEVEGILPNQKAVNFNIAMALLNTQKNAWGATVVSPKALRGQSITNEPGQVIVDWTETMNGIKKLEGSSASPDAMNLVDSIMQITRAVTGTTEVMTGETLGAGMSGAAIAQLQSQAQAPVEELRDSFWLVKEKQGKIFAQFFKLYYTDREFSYTEEGTGGKDTQQIDVFNSGEYQETEFSVIVETTAGTKASAAGDINMLDTLYGKGDISARTYVKAYPEDALSNKTELLKGIEEEEQNKVNQLAMQLQQSEAEKAQLSQRVEEQREAFESVQRIIAENGKLREQLATLFDEAYRKLLAANDAINAGNRQLEETTADARDFAQHIAQTEGVIG